MPPLNLLAEVLVLEQQLNEAQQKIASKRNSPIGKLPFVRSKLSHRALMLDVQQIQVEAARQYLEATTQ